MPSSRTPGTEADVPSKVTTLTQVYAAGSTPGSGRLSALLETFTASGETIVARFQTRSRHYVPARRVRQFDPNIGQVFPDLASATAAAQGVLAVLEETDLEL